MLHASTPEAVINVHTVVELSPELTVVAKNHALGVGACGTHSATILAGRRVNGGYSHAHTTSIDFLLHYARNRSTDRGNLTPAHGVKAVTTQPNK